MHCARCGRPLKRAAQTLNRFGVVTYYGPKCAQLSKPDPRQSVLELTPGRAPAPAPP